MTKNSLDSDEKDQKADSFRHDLTTHLSAIISLADLLRFETDLDQQRSLVEAVQLAADNAVAMIHEGPELRKTSLSVPASLPALFAQFEGLAKILAATHDSRFTLTLDPLLINEAPAVADPAHLHRILLLFLDNALKYGEGSDIDLAITLEEKRQIHIVMSDDGPGFGLSDPEKLFEPYHRGDQSEATIGSGLGLWSARRNAAFLGGMIWAEERKPHGAAFHLRLPIGEAAQIVGQMTPDTTKVLTPQTGTETIARTILVVDDNRTNHLILGGLVKAMGHSCMHADSGAQALQLAKGKKPDLALIDIRMAGMDGWQLAQSIQTNQNLRSIPLIAVSSDKQPKSIAPFSQWIQRPVDPASLFAAIKAHTTL